MFASVDDGDLDNGPKASKPGTVRMCALTRQVRPIDELIRFVVGPAGDVVADLKRKLPGRGLWISASRSALSDAAKRGVFAKGFKRDIRPSPTFDDDVRQLMVRGAIEALAMAAKGRQLVSGFTKVENALKRGEAVALIHALDGAADGIRKLDGLASGPADEETGERPAKLPVFRILTSAELDLALTRSNVIHAALLAGPASKTFMSRADGLVRFGTSEPGETTAKNSTGTTGANAPAQDLGPLDA
jgi:predicted RNA-binding protein YlxR (DUF448 family)